MLKLLGNDNDEAREIASLAIANLTNSNQNNCQVVMDKNVIDTLIKLLTDKKYEIQSNIAVCIANLAMNGLLFLFLILFYFIIYPYKLYNKLFYYNSKLQIMKLQWKWKKLKERELDS